MNALTSKLFSLVRRLFAALRGLWSSPSGAPAKTTGPRKGPSASGQNKYGPSPLTNAAKNAIIAKHLSSAAGMKRLAQAMTHPLRIPLCYGCVKCGWSTIAEGGVNFCPKCHGRVESFKPLPDGYPAVWGEEELRVDESGKLRCLSLKDAIREVQKSMGIQDIPTVPVKMICVMCHREETQFVYFSNVKYWCDKCGRKMDVYELSKGVAYVYDEETA